jgi:cytochrome c oxidase assembly protein subunit 11
MLALLAFMGVMSYQAGPFYGWVLGVVGLQTSPELRAKADERVLERRIKVRFDTSLGRDNPWVFKPAKREVSVQIGATGLGFFEVSNPTSSTLAGIARTAIAPYPAENYLTVIDGFANEVLVLKPGESQVLPVSFYVNPEIEDNSEARLVPAITLSFTFYMTELPQDEVSLVQTENNPLN